jgi:adenosyl cobinamide kinase/adenosyl cobinamide phosphate guanylyltransferase
VAHVSLILGGVRSGKSELAERWAGRWGDRVTYIATSVPDPADADMAARIDAHRARRPAAWDTVEAGTDLAAVVAAAPGPVLVDSLGTWVAAHPDLDPDADALCRALRGRTAPTILVSEEVGLGVHPETEVGRRFADRLGEVNRAVADIADVVSLVVAGRVVHLDRADRLPSGLA